MRRAPPGRASNSQTGFVKRLGPHHCATIFGSVQALNTSSRSASKTRVSTNSYPSFGVMLPVAMVFLLFLCVPQKEGRSEEHTSELQSLRHLVCRLLLEKKKKKTRTITLY